MDGENGYDEQGTTNREIVAKHLDIDTFVYVLSSRVNTVTTIQPTQPTIAKALRANLVQLPPGVPTWRAYTEQLLSQLPVESATAFRDRFTQSNTFWTTRGGTLTAGEVQALRNAGAQVVDHGLTGRSRQNHRVTVDVVPDDVPGARVQRVPSWRRLAICVLKGDVTCRFLGF